VPVYSNAISGALSLRNVLSDPSLMAKRHRFPWTGAPGSESGLLVFALRREVMMALLLRIRSEIASELVKEIVEHSGAAAALNHPHRDRSP